MLRNGTYPLWYLLSGIFVIACGLTFMARGFAEMKKACKANSFTE